MLPIGTGSRLAFPSSNSILRHSLWLPARAYSRELAAKRRRQKFLGPLTPKGPLVKYSLGISAAQPTSVLPSFVACLSLRLRTPSPIRHLWLPVLIASDENS